MNCYPTAELELKNLFVLALRQHWVTLRYAFVCIILLILSKYAEIAAMQFFANYESVLAIKTVFSVLVAFFFSTAVLAAHRSLTSTLPVNDVFKVVWKRLPVIVGTMLAYFIGIFALYYAMHYAVIVIHHFDHRPEPMARNIANLLGFVMILVFICVFFFSYPLAVTDGKSVKETFCNSAMLTEKNKIGILCLFFIVTATSSLLGDSELKIHFLSMYHLNALYDFVVLSIAIPLYINFLLLLINDSKQQVLTES